MVAGVISDVLHLIHQTTISILLRCDGTGISMSLNTLPQIKRQEGVGFTGYFFLLAVGIFIGLFVFKVGPHYFQNLTVQSIVTDLNEKPEILKQSRSKVYSHINKAYRQNNLWDIRAEDTIKLVRGEGRKFHVTVQYEQRTNLLHNIDLVTRFDTSKGEEEAENKE